MHAILREGGVKLGTASRAAFAGRVQEIAGVGPLILPLIPPLPAILEQIDQPTKQVLVIVR